MRSLLTAILLLCLVAPLHADSNAWKGAWIWNETPRKDNYFRKVISASDKPTGAKIAVTADNIYELYVNGQKIGSNDDWMNIEVYDVTSHIVRGDNVIAVKATDPGADVGGLLLEGALAYANGKVSVFGSDKSWKLSGTASPGWNTADFNDSSWQTPRSLGKPPAGPWGGLDHPSLAPRTPVKQISLNCPRHVKQGVPFTVTAQVKPLVDIPFDSPVALQAVVTGQPAYEQWVEPATPTTRWTPGKAMTLTFRSFRLPAYIPSGKLKLRVVTNATETIGAAEVTVGTDAVKPAAPICSSCSFTITPSKSQSYDYSVYVRATGAPRGTSFMFALYQGQELWSVSELTAGANKVKLSQVPHGQLRTGRYTAVVVPHRMQCPNPQSREVSISGAETTSLKPLGYGKYIDRDGVPHRWYVNPQGAMIWDGKPYIPVGAMFLSRFLHDYQLGAVADNERRCREDIRLLRTLRDSGVTDIYLNPCARWQDKPVWVWQRWADICEEVGMHYGIQVTNQVRILRAFHIAQDEYLVDSKGGETAQANITGVGGARPTLDCTVYYAAFDTQTNELLDTGKASIELAEVGINAKATPRVEQGRGISVHFIPEYEYGDGMHDYWAGLDQYALWARDFFGKLRFGPNLRLWIDPLDNEQGLGASTRLIPRGEAFRQQFAGYLKKSYTTPANLTKAWALSGADGIDFAAFARMIPLGKASAEVETGYAMDEVTGKTYQVDLSRSAMWHDMIRFRDSSIAHWNSEASEIIKSYHCVPVVLKGTDTDGFTNLRTHGGFDGVGMEAYGSAPELVRGCGGGVYSRCKQANRTMWTLTTETGLTEEYCGYPDPLRLTKELGSMLEMNGKGTFYFVLGAPSESGWSIFNLFDDPRQLIWLGAYSKLAKSSKKLPYYEPQVDYYFPGMIAGMDDGFGACELGFYGERPSQSVHGDSGGWVVTTSTQIPVDAPRIIANLENAPATLIHGREFEKSLKTREVVVVGHRKNLGALSIDSYYTDRFIEDGDGALVQALKPGPTSEVFATTQDGTIYGLRDKNLTIYSRDNWDEAVRRLAREPQGADFFSETLGLQTLDLGPALQGLHFGSTTYIWNLLEPGNTLALEVPAGARNVSITFADGTKRTVSGPARVTLPLPANALKPVRIENLQKPNITGMDEANYKAAMHKLNKAVQTAKSLGVDPGTLPSSNSYRALFTAADQLSARAEDTYRTTSAARMAQVKVDGNLVEWSSVKPIFMAYQVNVDYSYPSPYNGARFYTGYDENYIYIAGDVEDAAIVNNYRLDDLWNGDGVEVFIDLHPELDPGERDYSPDCFQFLFTPTDKDGKLAVVKKNPHLSPNTVPEKTLWSVSKRDGGWSFEAAIHRSDINGFQITPGSKIGFTIQLDDSDGGDRTAVRLWRGKKDTSRNRLAFGRLAFAP